MGTSRSAAQLGAKFEQAAKNLTQAQNRAALAAGLTVTTSVRAQIAAATRGSMFLSGVGKNGRKVGARYDATSTGSGNVIVRALGPLHLIERDDKAHPIPKVRKRRNRPYRHLQLADGTWVTATPEAPLHHPGTRGKHPFEKGVDTALPAVRTVFRATVHRSLGSVFGGA